MPFTKKTWISERIYYTDLNRIEDGVDDMHNNAMKFLGNKKFTSGIRTAPSKSIKLQNSATDALYMFQPGYDYSAVFDDPTSLNLPLLFDSKVELRTINSVYPELHGLRHKVGGADSIFSFADVVVSKPGEGGEFNDIHSAVSSMSANEILMVREGVFDTSAIIDMPPGSSLIGQGDSTIIRFVTNYGNISSVNNELSIRDIAIQSAVQGPTNIYLVSLSGIHNSLENVKVSASRHAVNLGGSYNHMNNCRVFNLNPSTTFVSVMLTGNYNRMIGCQLDGFYTGTGVTGYDNIIAGNEIESKVPPYATGINLSTTALRCVVMNNIVRGFQYSIVNTKLPGGIGHHIILGNMYNMPIQNVETSTIVANNKDMS